MPQPDIAQKLAEVATANENQDPRTSGTVPPREYSGFPDPMNNHFDISSNPG